MTSQSPHLPIFIQWLQVFGVLVIAAVGVWIAYHQMLTARVKLQHDLFERRYAVYKAVMKLWANTGQTSNPTMSDLTDFYKETTEAEFLFNSDITDYFREFTKHVSQIMASENILRAQYGSRELVDQHAELSSNHMAWITAQPDIIRAKFSPYLKIPLVEHPSHQLSRLLRRFRLFGTLRRLAYRLLRLN